MLISREIVSPRRGCRRLATDDARVDTYPAYYIDKLPDYMRSDTMDVIRGKKYIHVVGLSFFPISARYCFLELCEMANENN